MSTRANYFFVNDRVSQVPVSAIRIGDVATPKSNLPLYTFDSALSNILTIADTSVTCPVKDGAGRCFCLNSCPTYAQARKQDADILFVMNGNAKKEYDAREKVVTRKYTYSIPTASFAVDASSITEATLQWYLRKLDQRGKQRNAALFSQPRATRP